MKDLLDDMIFYYIPRAINKSAFIMSFIWREHAFVVYAGRKRTRETSTDFPRLLFQSQLPSGSGIVEVEKIMLDMFIGKIQAGYSCHLHKIWSN